MSDHGPYSDLVRISMIRTSEMLPPRWKLRVRTLPIVTRLSRCGKAELNCSILAVLHC